MKIPVKYIKTISSIFVRSEIKAMVVPYPMAHTPHTQDFWTRLIIYGGK